MNSKNKPSEPKINEKQSANIKPIQKEEAKSKKKKKQKKKIQ